MVLERLSKRARSAVAAARLQALADFTEDTAAEHLLAVHGCGRKTIREIAAALAAATGQTLGGLDRVMSGFSIEPTLTTGEAAKTIGVDVDAFLALTREASVTPKGSGPDGRVWSEWSIFAVRRHVWSRG